MTRSSIRRTLARTYWLLGLVLFVSLTARLADRIPGVAGTSAEKLLKDIYEYLKDMALVFVTVVAAYLASVFQRRSGFLAALKDQWHNIIKAKSALVAYTQYEAPSREQYVAAFSAISETIDNMRAVYGNVGENSAQIGLYPYAPLHDMRRALQAIEPIPGTMVEPEGRKLARDAILQSFYALRETFLEELDLEAPDNPLLIHGGRRLKKPGAAEWARRRQETQRGEADHAAPGDPRIAAFLTALYEREQGTAKPWREIAVPSAPAATPPPSLTGGAETPPSTANGRA